MRLNRIRVSRSDAAGEDDPSGHERDDRGRGEKRVRAQEPPRPGPSRMSEMLKARHRLNFGRESRNSGRFRYEIRMNGAKIPRPGEKNRYSGGSG
jgi:hypothetical protein